MNKIQEFIIRNTFFFYFGAALRYCYLRFLKKRKISFRKVLNGIEKPKTKEDEIYNMSNEFKNRLFAIAFLSLVVIILVLTGVAG